MDISFIMYGRTCVIAKNEASHRYNETHENHSRSDKSDGLVAALLNVRGAIRLTDSIVDSLVIFTVSRRALEPLHEPHRAGKRKSCTAMT